MEKAPHLLIGIVVTPRMAAQKLDKERIAVGGSDGAVDANLFGRLGHGKESKLTGGAVPALGPGRLQMFGAGENDDGKWRIPAQQAQAGQILTGVLQLPLQQLRIVGRVVVRHPRHAAYLQMPPLKIAEAQATGALLAHQQGGWGEALEGLQ